MGSIAAIDVGSHTARLLIARETPSQGARPVTRKRAYIRLAEDFLEPEAGRIKPGAIARTLEERLSLTGLDRGRADVILAGTLTVLCILNTFGATRMTVSLSDLLEGLLIEDAAGR